MKSRNVKSLIKINSPIERNSRISQEGMLEFQRYEHGKTKTVNRVLLIASLNSWVTYSTNTSNIVRIDSVTIFEHGTKTNACKLFRLDCQAFTCCHGNTMHWTISNESTTDGTTERWT